MLSTPQNPSRRKRRKRLFFIAGSIVIIALALLALAITHIVALPGHSHTGPLPALTTEQKIIATNLRRHIDTLATNIGPRSSHKLRGYVAAQDYLTTTLHALGYKPKLLNPTVIISDTLANIEAELPGNSRPEEILIVGAHYDTIEGVPGANDNGSGVAATLELARLFAGQPQARTLRFVLFHNEESVEPWGAEEYAQMCRSQNQQVMGMFALETIGYYTDAPNTQRYPFPLSLFYPSTGNFVAFVGSADFRPFLHQSAAAFRKHARFPSRGIAAPKFLKDATRSDHAPFWTEGYPAVMITDTANFRYPHYHDPSDTAEKVEHEHLARLVTALRDMVIEVAR